MSRPDVGGGNISQAEFDRELLDIVKGVVELIKVLHPEDCFYSPEDWEQEEEDEVEN